MTTGLSLRVAVIDYGAGNLASIGQALTAVGADVRLARTPSDLDGAEAMIVPGVGAAAPAMARLARQRLTAPIERWIADGRPYLGICLGLQLLFEGSDEDGARTFAILRGRTERLEGAPTLPHIGWNQVVQRRRHQLFDGVPDGANLYFVHSYAARPRAGDAASVLAETDHGRWFVSAVARENVLGVQFHPERSGAAGLRIVGNFVRWASDLARDPGQPVQRDTRPPVALVPGGGVV
ncbi:MAG TPA: imidazole glycerol phosphate synthase subunit HisH [Candidatus Limnocylindrales bacterium]|jgi:glutamine amidotransferase